MKMTFHEIRIIATSPCIMSQLRDVYKLATVSSHRFMGDPVGNVLKIIEPIETKLSRNVFGTSRERYRLLRASGSF